MENTEGATAAEIEALTEMGEQLINAILERKPMKVINELVQSGAPLWYQNVEGTSALHAAAYTENEEVAHMLIDEGSPWNAVDNQQCTAGDIALSLNQASVYATIRNAGIRAELLLTLLASKTSSPESASTIVLKSTDNTAAGSTDVFLSSRLRFSKDAQGQDVCLLDIDGEEVCVMMGWEREIMQETVDRLCNNHERLQSGLKVLNVGFGLGIIDSMFQSLPTPPSHHIIIEPHPDVLQHMRSLGWYDKKGVTILEGKWQDFIDSDAILGLGGFDVIYTDTFSEDYRALHDFFEHLPDLLAGPESRFSFFNGLGATNPLFYDVYTHMSELHLSDVGVDVDWSDVDVTSTSEETTKDRWGDTREYFTLPVYRLPIGQMRC